MGEEEYKDTSEEGDKEKEGEDEDDIDRGHSEHDFDFSPKKHGEARALPADDAPAADGEETQPLDNKMMVY